MKKKFYQALAILGWIVGAHLGLMISLICLKLLWYWVKYIVLFSWNLL